MKNQKHISRILAILMCVCMLAGMIPAGMATTNVDFVSETHDVVTRTSSTIAPGVTQDIVYAYAKDGKQMVYYVATADITRNDVDVYANYKDNQNAEFGMQKLTEQMAAAQKRNTTDTTAPNYNPYYTVVAGTNGDFYNMSSGRPSGAFVMEGNIVNNANGRPFFAILKDGTPVIGSGDSDWLKIADQVQEAVGGSQVLLKNGVDVTANANGAYNLERHCRTSVGITEDGKIVMMLLDGRQEPFSCGGTMHEIAQIMLEAGCVSAINLDGGGSSTYAARQEGENEVTIVNRPSDGSERSISSSLMIVSTTPPSDVFDRAVLTAENAYVTPGSSVSVSAVGVSPAGTAAEVPADAEWQLADSSMGTVENGVFVSNGTVGEAVVQLVVDGVVVGETTVNVVIPETISFAYTDIVVPYGKTVKFAMNATVNNGLNKVVLKDGDINFILSDASLGVVNGFDFTAHSGELSAVSGKVTAVFAYDETITAEANLTFGRGSEIVYDFENDDLSAFTIKSGYFHKDKKYGRWGTGDFEVVNKDKGFVKNGNNALAVTLDYSNFNSMGWKSVALSGFDIDLTDAVAVGMWMYIPANAYGMVEIDLNNAVIVDDYIAEVQSDDFDGGWFYVYTTDIASLGGKLSNIYFYQQDAYEGAEDDVNIMTKYTVYIDDITVDYSTAVDDRELPEFSYVRASYGGLSDAVNLNGQTIAENVVSATALATDNTAIDIASARAYVDGVELAADEFSCTDTGIITINDITFADGLHEFTFSISDILGNERTVTRSIVIDSGSDIATVKFAPKNPEADKVYIGSVQWFDLTATDIEKVESITTTIDLDNNSQWQLDNMVVADGFEAEYVIDEATNDATITIEKTGETVGEGTAVIASLPVRTWEHTNHLRYPDDVYTACSTGDATQANSPHTIWKTDALCHIAIIIEVDSGYVVYADGSDGTFSSDKYQVDTELAYHRNDKNTSAEVKAAIDATYSFHVHNEVAVEDKAATCTEEGYTGRTVCAGCICDDNPHNAAEACCSHDLNGCGSVIKWGTTIPATGHSYEMTEGVLKCGCGELYNGEYDGKLYIDGVFAEGWSGNSYYADGIKVTGIYLVDGYYYDFGEDGISKGKYTGFIELDDGGRMYSAAGQLSKGWMLIDGDYYYFNENTNIAYVGSITLDFGEDDVKYIFGKDGRLSSGVWVHTAEGSRYYYGPSRYYRTWAEIDGETYYFDTNSFCVTGYCWLIPGYGNPPQWYHFSDTGVLLETMTMTGLFEANGKLYYLENGISKTGLILAEDGNYYYFTSSDYSAVSGKYWVSNTNGLDVEQTYHYFDEETHAMVVEKPDETPKNGLVEENGELYYYVNGELNYAGLIEVDGDYYYINSYCKAVKGEYWVSKTNGLMAAKSYIFGEDGKMLNPEVKNGLIEENGELYYYVDGELNYAGLIEVNGDYYYINSYCKAVTGEYWVSKNNGLMETKYYTFGEDGKMIIDTDKNGLIEENGELYYYVDGQRTYAGLIEVDGDYYYINSYCKAVKGQYWVSKTNGLMDAKYYTFGEDGKMVKPVVTKNGLIEENGELYYYVNGELNYAGLIEVDGDYYYINSYCKAVKGKYWVSKTNGLMDAKYYTFGEDGKMIIA